VQSTAANRNGIASRKVTVFVALGKGCSTLRSSAFGFSSHQTDPLRWTRFPRRVQSNFLANLQRGRNSAGVFCLIECSAHGFLWCASNVSSFILPGDTVESVGGVSSPHVELKVPVMRMSRVQLHSAWRSIPYVAVFWIQSCISIRFLSRSESQHTWGSPPWPAGA
jgi:hypothetical protein